MVKSKETPEQKLLKMMEVNDSPSASSRSRKKKSGFPLIRLCNVFLFLLMLASFAWLAYEIDQGKKMEDVNINISLDRNGRQRSDDSQRIVGETPRLSSYLAGVKHRNIFRPYEDSIAQNVVEVSENNTEIVRRTKHLRLVGISWLDRVDTAAAMIEDVKQNITHVRHKGEKLDDVEIKTIYADSVALGYKDEEIIIRYDKPQM